MKFTLAFVSAGLAGLAAVHGAAVEKRSANIDTTILNYALTLEYLEAFFYKQALARFSADDFEAAGYAPFVRQRIVEVGAEEQIHATTLASVLGKKATVPCTYSFPYETVTEFLTLSSIIEGVGVSAYLGAAPLITDKGYLAAAGSILTIEARHQSVISEFLGLDGVPGAFDTPLDFDQVYTLASQFIVKCPKNAAKLPVMAFPALALSPAAPKSGSTIKLNFKPVKKCDKPLYAQFINGLSVVPVKLDSHWDVKVPKGFMGRVYVVVTMGSKLSDAATVAGPALFELGTPDL